jgi:hypothetical protein
MEMKIRLMEELEEHMPETTKFSVGYMGGRQSTKCWICCEDDLHAMYTAYASCPQIVEIAMKIHQRIKGVRLVIQ